jgi:hypothetical protein
VPARTTQEENMAEKKRIPFNVNDGVRIKLNDIGREILRQQNIEFVERSSGKFWPSMPKEDADGWSEWQLWDVMHRFGDHMRLGMVVPFETAIEIIVREGE